MTLYIYIALLSVLCISLVNQTVFSVNVHAHAERGRRKSVEVHVCIYRKYRLVHETVLVYLW